MDLQNLQKELQEDYKREVEDVEKKKKEVRKSLAKEIIEKTLMPAFETAHQADKTYRYAEVCVFTYPTKYSIIPAPFDSETIVTYCYPKNDLTKLISDEDGLQTIWDLVCSEKEKYHFDVERRIFGRNGYFYSFYMDFSD